MFESLRLGLLKPTDKFGKMTQLFEEPVRKMQGRHKPIIEGASPPSKNENYNLGQNYNPLDKFRREHLLVQKDTTGMKVEERQQQKLCEPTRGLGQSSGLGAARQQQLGQEGLASQGKLSK